MKAHERRRYERIELSQTDSRLLLVAKTSGAALEQGSLLNVSVSGMCFSIRTPLPEKTTHEFHLHFRGILADVAEVKAEIRWVQQAGPSKWIIGAEFLESNRGYLVPDDDLLSLA